MKSLVTQPVMHEGLSQEFINFCNQWWQRQQIKNPQLRYMDTGFVISLLPDQAQLIYKKFKEKRDSRVIYDDLNLILFPKVEKLFHAPKIFKDWFYGVLDDPRFMEAIRKCTLWANEGNIQRIQDAVKHRGKGQAGWGLVSSRYTADSFWQEMVSQNNHASCRKLIDAIEVAGRGLRSDGVMTKELQMSLGVIAERLVTLNEIVVPGLYARIVAKSQQVQRVPSSSSMQQRLESGPGSISNKLPDADGLFGHLPTPSTTISPKLEPVVSRRVPVDKRGAEWDAEIGDFLKGCFDPELEEERNKESAGAAPASQFNPVYGGIPRRPPSWSPQEEQRKLGRFEPSNVNGGKSSSSLSMKNHS